MLKVCALNAMKTINCFVSFRTCRTRLARTSTMPRESSTAMLASWHFGNRNKKT